MSSIQTDVEGIHRAIASMVPSDSSLGWRRIYCVRAANLQYQMVVCDAADMSEQERNEWAEAEFGNGSRILYSVAHPCPAKTFIYLAQMFVRASGDGACEGITQIGFAAGPDTIIEAIRLHSFQFLVRLMSNARSPEDVILEPEKVRNDIFVDTKWQVLETASGEKVYLFTRSSYVPGAVKVGISDDVERRIGQLNREGPKILAPGKLVYEHATPHPRDLETATKKEFNPAGVRRTEEWLYEPFDVVGRFIRSKDFDLRRAA